MFKVKVRREQIDYARELLKTTNFARRGDGTKKYNNGNAEEQFVGILSQVVVADMLKQPRPNGDKKVNEKHGDHGVDYIVNGIKVDLKAMGRHCDVKENFIHNLHGDQVGKYYENDVYLFSSLNKNNMELTICGWVTKDDFFEKANFYPQGAERENPSKKFTVRSPKGLYEIPNNKLNGIFKMKSFTKTMARMNGK